ncbi:unnamed protein product [Arabidopsis halleri]
MCLNRAFSFFGGAHRHNMNVGDGTHIVTIKNYIQNLGHDVIDEDKQWATTYQICFTIFYQNFLVLLAC